MLDRFFTHLTMSMGTTISYNKCQIKLWHIYSFMTDSLNKMSLLPTQARKPNPSLSLRSSISLGVLTHADVLTEESLND